MSQNESGFKLKIVKRDRNPMIHGLNSERGKICRMMGILSWL
jgi:hypothetical protein